MFIKNIKAQNLDKAISIFFYLLMSKLELISDSSIRIELIYTFFIYFYLIIVLIFI